MESRTLRWFLALLLACASSAYAQRCSEDYSAIDEPCIRSKSAAFKADGLLINKNLANNVYFYQTNLGHFGKMKIISVATESEMSPEEKKAGKRECTVYFEASTFVNGKPHTPNSTLSIRAEYNIWQQDSVGLDHNGPYDFSLERDDAKGGCLLRPTGAKWVFHSKITQGVMNEQGSPILYYSSLGLIALAVFLVARATLEEESKFKASETLEEAETDRKNQVNDFVLKYSRPFFKRYFTPVVMGMKGRQGLKTKYRRKLANAGLTRDLTPEDFFAFKLFLIIGFPVVFIILRILLEETWPMSLIPVLGVLGFFYPDIWINGRMANRKEEIIRGMPFIVDMLALSVEAGLDFMAAIQKIIDKAPPGPIIEEFETLIKETKIGSSRAEGLRQLSWRTDVISVNSFCATLIAADSVGASIAPILKQLSAEIRQKRSSDAEKKGATAATKILFPMILFIMPAVFIAIAGPMAIKLITGEGGP